MACRKVTLIDIFEYLEKRRRPMEEGEALFKAGHVIMCGYKIEAGNVIFALCLQTSALYSPPHEINITLSDTIANWECRCTCKAGNSARCKHIFAVLIYVNRHEELEVLSCTDMKQIWGKEKEGLKEIYEVVPVIKFCHPTGLLPKKSFRSSEALNSMNFEILHKCDETSALGKFKTREKLLLPEVVNIQSLSVKNETQPSTSSAVVPSAVLNNCFQATTSLVVALPLLSEKEFKVNTSNVVPAAVESKIVVDKEYGDPHIVVEHLLKTNEVLCKLISEPHSYEEFYNANIKLDLQDITNTYVRTFRQGSEEWLKSRKYRITSSVCYSIFTYSKNKSPDWDKKTENFINPKFQGNMNTEYGKRMEPKAKRCYENKYGCKTNLAGLVIAPLAPWLAFSADALLIDGRSIKKIIEFKCPISGKFASAEKIVSDLPYIYTNNGTLFLKKKHQYYGQIQLGMCLLNVNICDFVIYSSFDDTCVTVTVNYDKLFVEHMITVLHKTYFKEILPRIS